MKLINIFIIVSVAWIASSCEKSVYDDGDFFFLVNKGAQMPVVVRGNKESEIFLIFIHGGPGGTAIQKIGLPVFNTLEIKYATVFYDQRSSGSSQGNSDDKYLTVDQFVEDLDQVIALINQKYNNPKIFLMGHSWGGCLGTAYLLDASRQQKITGWIEIDGAHNNPSGDSASMQFVIDYAHQQISKGTDTGIWNYALEWYEANPNFTSDQLEHYAFLEQSHAYIHDPTIERTPKTFPNYTTDYLFNSPADLTAQLTNYNHVIRKFIISDIDLTNQMKNITIPSLILWGANDGVIPVALAKDAYDKLGTIVSKKNLVVLQDAAHYSFYEQPDMTATAITDFVEKNK